MAVSSSKTDPYAGIGVAAQPDPYAGVGSDPYAGIGTAEPEQNYLADKARRAGRAAVTGFGDAIAYFGRMAKASDEFLTNINPLLTDPQKERINTNSDAGTSTVETGQAIKAAGATIKPDPARDKEVGAIVAEAAGALAPAVVSAVGGAPSVVATVAAQMGESERDRSLQDGATPEEADARAKVAAAGGGVLALTPAGPVRGAAGALERMAVRAATGAAVNAAQDAAQQKALDNQVDWRRVQFSALFGGGLGLLSALPEAVKVRAQRRIEAAQKAADKAALDAAEVDRIVAEELAKAPLEEQHATATAIQRHIESTLGPRDANGEFPNVATPERQAMIGEALARGEVTPRVALDAPAEDPAGYARWWVENTMDQAGPAERSADVFARAMDDNRSPVAAEAVRGFLEAQAEPRALAVPEGAASEMAAGSAEVFAGALNDNGSPVAADVLRARLGQAQARGAAALERQRGAGPQAAEAVPEIMTAPTEVGEAPANSAPNTSGTSAELPPVLRVEVKDRKAAAAELAALRERLPSAQDNVRAPQVVVKFADGGSQTIVGTKEVVDAVSRRYRTGNNPAWDRNWKDIGKAAQTRNGPMTQRFMNPTAESAAADLAEFRAATEKLLPLEQRAEALSAEVAKLRTTAARDKRWVEVRQADEAVRAERQKSERFLGDARATMGKPKATLAEVGAWLETRARQAKQMGIADENFYRGELTKADVGEIERLRRGIARFVSDATNPRAVGFVAPGFDVLNERLKKWAPSWFLPNAMRDTLRLGDQATNAILSRGGALQKDLRMALLGIEDTAVRAQQMSAVQAFFTGQAPVTALEPSVRAPAQQVRSFIDGLSDRAVAEGVVSGELADKFTDNLGKYLRRSYMIHADPDYAPKRQQITAAIDAVQRHNKVSREEAAQLVNDLLDRNQRAAQVSFFSGRGKLAGKDVSAIVARKDLLPEIRDLLGEIHDPIANVGETIPRLARMIEQHHAQVAMRDLGLKLGVFRDVAQRPLQDFEVGKWVPLVSEGSATHDVWAGLHALPEVREALTRTAASGRVDGLRGITWRIWRGATGVAKTAKTVLNPDSYAPNFIGGIVSGAANGNFRVDQLGRGLMLGAEEIGALRWLQKKGLMPANRADLQEEVAKLTKLGLRGENLSAADLQQTLDRSILRPLAEKTIKPLQNIYGGTDDLTKYIAWKSEMSRYARAFPAMPREELEQLAANVVRDTMPTYSQVPQVLREASQLGLAPTFVNFTYEVFRNTANTVRIGTRDLRAGVASGNRGLIRAGAERLAAATAALGIASGYGWARFSRANNGVTDEQDQAVRFFGPSWNKNGQLVYNSPVGADGKVQFSNQSYLIPQALLFEAAGEAGRAKDAEGMLNAFLGAIGQQFLGIENSVVLDSILDAARGVDSTGRRVINPESPTINQDRLAYIADKAFKPVVADKIKRMTLAYRGQLSESGRSYSLSEEAMRLGGMRAQTLDAGQAARFKARALAERMSDATALYRQQLKLNLTPEQLEATYGRSEQARRKVFADLQDYYRFGRLLNVPEDALIENLRKGGLSSSVILGVLDGVYVPGAKEQPETPGEIFARLRNMPEEQRQAALRAVVLKQPTIVKALAERVKEEARGLSGRDKLIRSLGVGDGERADYIRARIDALPDAAAKRDYVLRLARRGVITGTIAEQLAQPKKK